MRAEETPERRAPASTSTLRLRVLRSALVAAKRSEAPALFLRAPARLKLCHGVLVAHVAPHINSNCNVDDVSTRLLLREGEYCVRHKLLRIRPRARGHTPVFVDSRGAALNECIVHRQRVQ